MYPPHHAGGYEFAWQAAMRHAQSLGHRVRILASDHREPIDREEDDPEVYRTLRWYWDQRRYEFAHQGRVDRALVEVHNSAELRRHLRAFRPDIVTWWSMGCMSLSLIERVRRKGIPALSIVHDDWLVYGPQFDAWMRAMQRRPRLARPAERLVGLPVRVDVSAAGPLVFNSRYTLERARDAGIDVSGATVVHPGIDPRFLEAAPAQPWRWRLLYVGRIDRQKGLDTAVAALAHLPPATTLEVLGSGDVQYIAELQQLARRLGAGDRVHFDGFAGPDQVRAAYADADVVLFPVRWQEPFGLVPIEAMGVGRPVVTTARGGTAEFVRHEENALVFEADDGEGLATCVMRLAEDESLRLRLVEGGSQTAAGHSLEQFAARTVEQILGALAAAKHGSAAAPVPA